MTTTQRKPARGKKTPPVSTATVMVDTQGATPQATEFVYAVIAALGLNLVELTDSSEQPVAASLQVWGNTISAGNQQWHYPDHEAAFEHWLVTTCFRRVKDSTVWAVVQTGVEVFPLLAAAMAYAHADDGALLIDADATGKLSETILEATGHRIEPLAFDLDLPSAHIYLLNAPRWHHVTLMLDPKRSNPLHSVLLRDTVHAARHHFAHTVIDCGADLFLAQRLAEEGAQVVHVDDHSRPLYMNLEPYKRINYFSHRIPEYGTRRDVEYLVNAARRRRGMRRWMQRGDTP